MPATQSAAGRFEAFECVRALGEVGRRGVRIVPQGVVYES